MAGAAGANGGANGDFASPRSGLREQQIRDVGAGDEEHQRDRSQQEVERELDIFHHFIAHARDGDILTFVAGWILLFEPRTDGG